MYRVFPATSELASDIARLYNHFYASSGIACWHPRVSGEDMARLLEAWKAGGTVLAVLELSDRIAAFAWGRVGSGKAWIGVMLDSSLPRPLALEAYVVAVRWVARRILAGSPLGPVLLSLGVYYSPAFWVGVEALSLSPGDVAREYTLMEAPASNYSIMVPEGFDVLVYREPPRGRLLAGIVDVVNDAFSVYVDSEEWSVEEAEKWLATLFERRPGSFVALVVRDDRVVGVAIAYPINTICGEVKLYLSTLAVARAFQGMGLGRSLVATVMGEARLLGARSVVVDSEPAVEGLYYRLGFSPVAWWARATLAPSFLGA